MVQRGKNRVKIAGIKRRVGVVFYEPAERKHQKLITKLLVKNCQGNEPEREASRNRAIELSNENGEVSHRFKSNK